MATVSWLAATIGQPTRPGQINQFLGSHSSAWLYSGNTLQSSEATGSGIYQSSDGQYMAQTFSTTAAQTTIGQVLLQISTVGGSPVTASIAPLEVSLYANLNGVPSGTPIVSTTVTEQYVYLEPFWVTVPLAVTGLTAATPYWLVVSPAGGASAYYVWQQSNQTTGAALSPDGVSWSDQAYGFMFEVYDQTGTNWPPVSLTDDDGARVTTFTYTATNLLSTITESVVAQNGASFYSQRTISYSGVLPTGVS